jgi:hypothetical protein
VARLTCFAQRGAGDQAEARTHRPSAAVPLLHCQGEACRRPEATLPKASAEAPVKGVSFLTWCDVADDVRNGLLGFVLLENRRLKERLSLCTASNRKTDPEVSRVLSALARRLALTVDGSL